MSRFYPISGYIPSDDIEYCNRYNNTYLKNKNIKECKPIKSIYLHSVYGTTSILNLDKPRYLPYPVKVKKVIFNPPATIVFWDDDTKTVVKDEDIKKVYHIPEDKDEDNFLEYLDINSKFKEIDYTKWKELGLLNAMVKRAYPHFNKTLDKWCL